ncbi:MAG: hypothetical protein RLZZ444_476 [Pseudomonadota bacterium]|jgi:hypothetical protein
MNAFGKTLILSAASIAVLASSFEFASARDRYWRHPHGRHVNNTAIAAGVIGLTAGVIIGNAIASEPRVVYRPRPVYRPRTVIVDEGPVYDEVEPVYVEPEARLEGPVEDFDSDDARVVERQDQARDYFPEAPARERMTRTNVADGYSLEPWTPDWRAWCAERYRSFNPSTGTYRGYDSRDHFCTAG